MSYQKVQSFDKMKDAIIFLLNHPPLEEIGGSITGVIDQFRSGHITEKQATNIIIEHHKRYVQKYLNGNILMREDFLSNSD